MSDDFDIKKHSAPGQMLGYLYQIDRALLWLSMCPPNSVVSIETDDDVVIDIKNGKQINQVFEQDKSSIGKRNPFSDKSKDLWKTLVIWLDLIKNKKLDVTHSRFFLVTNVKVKMCIAYQINKNNIGTKNPTEKEKFVIEKYEKLKQIAEKPSASFKKDAEKFLTYTKAEIIALLKQIELIDNDYPDYNRNEYKKKVASNLFLTGYPENQIYDGLYGWIVSEITDFWLSNKEANLKVEMLQKQRDFLIAQYEKKPFIEKAANSIPLSEGDIKQERNETFVKQLEKIKASEKITLNAIKDYIRAKKQRILYAESNRVLSREDFLNFEADLVENWERVFEKHIRFSDTKSSEEDCGYQIFYETTEYKGSLKGEIPIQRYTSSGAYHKLANNLNLGWHPNWEQIFKNDE